LREQLLGLDPVANLAVVRQETSGNPEPASLTSSSASMRRESVSGVSVSRFATVVIRIGRGGSASFFVSTSLPHATSNSGEATTTNATMKPCRGVVRLPRVAIMSRVPEDLPGRSASGDQDRPGILAEGIGRRHR
jgi:hypothetical protein